MRLEDIIGSKSDPAVATDSDPGTLISLIRRLFAKMPTVGTDSTDRLRVSTYGKSSAAGDTPLLLTPAGRVLLAAGTATALVDGATNTVALPTDSTDSIRQGIPAYGFLYNGATWDRRRAVNISKTAQSTATASGSALDVWTPSASKKFRLRGVVVAASVAGRYELRDGTSTVLAYLRLGANAPLAFQPDANGILSSLANNVLKLYNQAGSAADMDILAWGNEE